MPYPRLAAPLIIGLALLFGSAPAPAQAPAAPQAQPPAAEPDAPQPLKPGDAFGLEVTLPARTIIYLQGHANWDNAFDTLVDAYASLDDYLAKQGIQPTGPAMTIYTETDDTGFKFRPAGGGRAEEPAQGRHRGRPGTRRQGAQIRPPRFL
jgi:hypothetical protein